MLKKLGILMVLLLALLTSVIPVSAAEEQPVIYKQTVTVTNEGGFFQVGFATVEFKKDFLEGQLPATFDIEIYADSVKKEVGIQVLPHEERLDKPVHVRVDAYEGYLYDKVAEKNIWVSIKKQQVIVKHFSRFAFS